MTRADEFKIKCLLLYVIVFSNKHGDFIVIVAKIGTKFYEPGQTDFTSVLSLSFSQSTNFLVQPLMH